MEDKQQTSSDVILAQKTPASMVIAWAAGQPFTNVLLTALLAMCAWVAYYGLTVAVPEHLRMIQTGYKELDASHREERSKDRELHKEDRQQYDKWIERITTTIESSQKNN